MEKKVILFAAKPQDFELSEQTSDLPELKEFSEILVENDNIKQL